MDKIDNDDDDIVCQEKASDSNSENKGPKSLSSVDYEDVSNVNILTKNPSPDPGKFLGSKPLDSNNKVPFSKSFTLTLQIQFKDNAPNWLYPTNKP